MPVRTDADTVKAILLKDYDTQLAPALTQYILAASMLTDDIATFAAANAITVSDERLTVIESWLAAHSYAISDRPFKAARTNKAGATFQGETKMALDSSHYGQQAKLLDPTGYLKKIDEEDIAAGAGESVFWVGKRPSQRKTYGQRY